MDLFCLTTFPFPAETFGLTLGSKLIGSNS